MSGTPAEKTANEARVKATALAAADHLRDAETDASEARMLAIRVATSIAKATAENKVLQAAVDEVAAKATDKATAAASAYDVAAGEYMALSSN